GITSCLTPSERNFVELWVAPAWLFRFRGLFLFRAVKELDLVSYHFRRLPPNAILVVVGTNLQPTFHGHQAAFGDVLGYDLGEFTPRHYVDKVRPALAVLAHKRLVHRKCKGGYGCPVLGVSQVWICG